MKEHPIKTDDLGVPPFSDTSICPLILRFPWNGTDGHKPCTMSWPHRWSGPFLSFMVHYPKKTWSTTCHRQLATCNLGPGNAKRINAAWAIDDDLDVNRLVWNGIIRLFGACADLGSTDRFFWTWSNPFPLTKIWVVTGSFHLQSSWSVALSESQWGTHSYTGYTHFQRTKQSIFLTVLMLFQLCVLMMSDSQRIQNPEAFWGVAPFVDELTCRCQTGTTLGQNPVHRKNMRWG